GFGRPENASIPATALDSADLDVAMLDDHEAAKLRIYAAIRGSRIADQRTHAVDVRCRRRAGLVRPQAVTSKSVPVEIQRGCDEQSNEMAFLWTCRLVRLHECVAYCCGAHAHA